MAALRSAFDGVCADFGCVVREAGHEEDHVHLLVDIVPDVSISRLVNSLKGVSARRVRAMGLPEVERALWGRHFWSPSYCAVSCGGAPLDVVAAYVRNQKQRSSRA